MGRLRAGGPAGAGRGELAGASTIRSALRGASGELARLDAEVLLAHVLGRSRSHLAARPEAALAEADAVRFRALVARRAAGEPVAYLVGHREFWSLDLEVDARVLIPRPETESLVERALVHLAPGQTAWIADLGTGSGAVAAAIATERPAARVVAIDRSRAALAVAAANFSRLGLDNATPCAGNWCEPLAPARFALIVSNPPYVAAGDPHLDAGDVRHEPRAALVGGRDGLDCIRAIAAGAAGRLAPGGVVIVEHGHDQGAAVRAVLAGAGLVAVETHRDLEGRERLATGRRPR